MTLELLQYLKDKWIDIFKSDCRNRHLTEETIRRYVSAVKMLLIFFEERGKTALDVDRHILGDFVHYRRNCGGRNGVGVDQKTLENDFSALSTFYDFLVFEEYTSNNPVLAVRKHYLIKYKDDEEERKVITVEEMVMLINSILSVRDKTICVILAKTGIRRGELISLDIDDIDWAKQSITLKRKKFKKRSNRSVFFDDECHRLLKRWISTRSKMNLKTHALFVGEHRERLNRNGVYSLVTKYAERIGLHNPESERIEDHFSPHNFRHWFTTWLRRNKMPREFIQVLRGDRRREAIDIYDRIDRDELRKAYLASIPQLGI